MDFIKTSSLRALIELTFQRNWNGFIWMSRKGVIAKRVKAAPDGHIENQRRTAQSGWPRNDVPRSAKTVSVRLMSRPKSNVGRAQSRPGKHCPRSATPRHDRARPTARAGSNASRPRNSRVPRRCAVRAGKLRPASGRDFIGQFHPSDHSRPTASSGPDRSDSAKDPTVRPTVPTTVRTPRSTRSRF
ncbi:unnamed protein product [Microthlaspi erraticum]|uniref:Uncharacterized protein n=1 Tax=Microthlaspi erraticum TaxID=1685480 RepID=A0A6D2KMT0_9BRAS|nr:unnamed protein product [Microthlaspi erraticum]